MNEIHRARRATQLSRSLANRAKGEISRPESYGLFETPLGRCGLCWSEVGITKLQLPEVSDEMTRERLIAGRPGALERKPPRFVVTTIGKLRSHLSGSLQDFSKTRLDLRSVTPFRRTVYEALRGVRAGSLVSYGELATIAGSPDAARAVGGAMAANPIPIVVPCHRVLASTGRIGGFSAHGGARTKVQLLALEGVVLPGSALGLTFEPADAMRWLSDTDPLLGALIAHVGPLRLLVDPMESPFVTLVKAILYQQLTGKAAATIQGRLKALYGGQLPSPERLLETSDEDLRGVGISRAKVAALKDLAAKDIAGVVPSLRSLKVMTDEEIIERLTNIRGIGRWTVEMMLIFRLGRADVFPQDDYGVRKGLTFLLDETSVVSPRRAAEHGRRWERARTTASWYLWRAGELGRERVRDVTAAAR